MKQHYSTMKIVNEKEMTQKKLAELTGRRPTTMSNMFVRDGMGVNTLCEILSVLNYELVIQPCRRGKRADGQYVVERVDVEIDGCGSEEQQEQMNA